MKKKDIIKRDRKKAEEFVDSLRKDEKRYTVILGEYKGTMPDKEGISYFRDRRDLHDVITCLRTLGKHYWIPMDNLNISQSCRYCGKIRE